MDIELIEGRLCEKGYLKERYDKKTGDLKRTLTIKGLNEIRRMLKEPEWRKIAVVMMKMRGWTDEDIAEFFQGL